MSSQPTGVFRRTRADQQQDFDRIATNLENEAWKEWPNEAGFAGLTEHRGPIPLKITGRFPAYAAGSLYRTGPGVSEIPNCRSGFFSANKTHRVSHWFDGFAHTHKFDILPPSSPGEQNCSVTYSSRRQSDEYVEHIKKAGWRAGISFGQKADPCVGLFAKAMAVFEPKRMNNNVVVLSNVPGLDAIGKDHAMDGVMNGSFISGYSAPVAGKQNGSATSPSSSSSKEGGRLSSGHRTTASNIWISTDNATIQRVDPSTLEPVGSAAQSALHPDLRGPLSCAHAQRDPNTGDLFNFNLELGKVPTYRVFRSSTSTGETEILATFAGPDLQPAYIHSLFLTERFVVLCIPVSHFAWNGIKVVWERNLLDAIRPFDATQKCQWVVVDRLHGKGVVGRFTTPAGFFFHSINSFDRIVPAEGQGGKEEAIELNLDVVMYDDTDIMFGFYYDVILDREDSAKKFWLTGDRHKRRYGRLVRYRYSILNDITTRDPVPLLHPAHPDVSIPVGQGEEAISIPAPHAGELPTVNPLFATRDYRYAYMTATRGLSTLVDSLVKTDVRTGEVSFWSGGQGHTPGEAIFVADPEGDGTEEDAGVVLSMVLDGRGRKSYLVCLDARTMEEMGRADADFPIGMGFHGVHEKVKL